MKGIYCFTNTINGKKYIGQSYNIEQRYKSHKRNYTNSNLHSYGTAFYRALRKYGFENFKFEILVQSDSFTKEELNEQEIYYIAKFDSFKNGYNMNYGGQYTSNINKKLTEAQVLEIKEKILNTNMQFTDIAVQYGLSRDAALVSMINKGKVWGMTGEYHYPLRENATQMRTMGEKNPRAKFSDEEILKIRERYIDETMPSIYEDYKKRCSFSELKKIIYGSQYKHLPVYKKRQKIWMLEGTCIDYPCLKE